MNKLTICFAFLLLPFANSVFAQTDSEGKAQINQVLKDHDDYIYSDITSSSEEKALQQAMSLIEKELQNYTSGNGNAGDEVTTGIVTKDVVKVTVARGDQYRAFVYIKKSAVDAAEASNANNTTASSSPSVPAQTKAATTPSAEKPAPQRVTEVSAPATSGRVVYNTSRTTDSDIITAITAMSTLQELGSYLPEKRKCGAISHYDNYRSLSDPAAYYLVACDKTTGQIVAVLSPGRDIRTNLKTHQADKVENYQNCKIIGFRLAK